MFKINNKDTRTTSQMSFWCLYCQLWTYLTPFLVFLLLTLNMQLPAGLILELCSTYRPSQQWKHQNNVWIMFKVNNDDNQNGVNSNYGNNKAMCETWSKLTVKRLERHQWSLDTLMVNFHILFRCFHRWLWTSKCQQGEFFLCFYKPLHSISLYKLYLFKTRNSAVSTRNTRKRYEICSKLTIKTPERRHRCRSGVFIVNFEHI